MALLAVSCGGGGGSGGDDGASAAPSTVTDATAPSQPAAPRPPSVEELLGRQQVLTIAHAGGDQAHPHSTLFAFAESVREGADVLELDVQLSADGVLVVQHDETVDKTTEATGPVVERTLAELQALDNAYWFSPACWPCHDRPEEEYVYRGVRTGQRPPPPGSTPDDFRIPTFREVAERFPDLPLDVEIKGERHVDPLDVARALAAEIASLGRTDSTIVAAFDSRVVAAFHQMAPDVAVSPGVAELAAWFLAGEPLPEHYGLIQIPPSFEGTEVLTPALLERAHADGLEVWVWPDDRDQENAATYRRWTEMGVDGVIAGRPADMAAAGG